MHSKSTDEEDEDEDEDEEGNVSLSVSIVLLVFAFTLLLFHFQNFLCTLLWLLFCCVCHFSLAPSVLCVLLPFALVCGFV